MKVLAALLLSIALVSPAGGQSKFPAPSSLTLAESELLFTMHADAWELACMMKRADCSDIPRPVVVYGFLPYQYGRYWRNESVVVIDIRLVGQPLSVLVAVHEMIHYIQMAQGQAGMGPCTLEREAFELVFELNRRLELVTDTRLKNWDSVITPEDGSEPYTIAEGYGCPEPPARP